jgi:hypothetical protein
MCQFFLKLRSVYADFGDGYKRMPVQLEAVEETSWNQLHCRDWSGRLSIVPKNLKHAITILAHKVHPFLRIIFFKPQRCLYKQLPDDDRSSPEFIQMDPSNSDCISLI